MTRAACVLGIDVGGTAISAGLVNARGEVLGQPLFRIHHDEPLVIHLATIARELCSRRPVRAIGVGVPGAVDQRRGVVREVFNLPELGELQLRAMLRRKLHIPIALDNDVNAMALFEMRWGAARAARDFVLIALGTGVGGAIVLDRKLRRGAHGYAGEVGHATVKVDGRECFCGSVGCLKAYAAGPDIVQQYGEAALTTADVFARARRGDERAKAVIAGAAQALGASCANIINMIDPELIIIGGSVAQASELLVKPAREWARRFSLPGVRGQTPIVRSQLNKASAFLGAAALAWELRSSHSPK